MAIAPTPTPKQKSKHNRLQHTTTGRIFAWNEELVKRKDMVAYIPPATVVVKAPEPVAVEPEVVEAEVNEEPSPVDMAKLLLGKKSKG